MFINLTYDKNVFQFSSTLTEIAEGNFEFCFLTLDGIKVMQVHKLTLAMYLSDALYKLPTLSMTVKDKKQCFKSLISFYLSMSVPKSDFKTLQSEYGKYNLCSKNVSYVTLCTTGTLS